MGNTARPCKGKPHCKLKKAGKKNHCRRPSFCPNIYMNLELFKFI
uniref:Uncharacterized protein n=1 Tax=Anguilla anguilla TaxID=7936 RepID=A0A0E9XWH2_ANGAN